MRRRRPSMDTGAAFFDWEENCMQELHGEMYCYDLLRRIFSVEPSLELLQQIGGIKPLDGTDEISRGMKQMVDSVKRNEGRLEEWREELSVEFARLFLGPIRPIAVSYASYYLSESRQLMTEETIDVRRRYLEAGMAVKDLYSIPDDHICIELEFLYYLTGEIIRAHEVDVQERVREMERVRDEFVNDHLLRWVPMFVDRITDSEGDEFYRGAAILLGGVLQSYGKAD